MGKDISKLGNSDHQSDPTGRRPATSARGVRLGLSLYWLTVAAALSIGLYWHWPYLVREHRRIEPWRIGLIWFDDLVAFAWFVWFAISCCLLGRTRLFESGQSRDLRPFLLTVGVAILGDAANQIWLIRQEQVGFAAATVTQGEVVAYRTIGSNGGWYVLSCSFVDSRGLSHTADFQVHEEALPPALAQALNLNRLPAPIQISYDPDWPDRSWVTAIGFDDENRLAYCILSTLVFQVIGLAMLIGGKPLRTPRRLGVPIYESFPLVVDAFVLVLVAIVMFVSGDSW